MNTATRLRRREKNLVTKYNPNGDSKVDLSGLSSTDVVWVRACMGSSDFIKGRFIRLDESTRDWFTVIEVFKASPKQAAAYLKASHFVELKPGVDRVVSYTIDGEKQFLASWGAGTNWSGIGHQAKGLARDAASHYYSTHPESGYKPVTVKLDVNGADLGTYAITIKLNPEYTATEVQ